MFKKFTFSLILTGGLAYAQLRAFGQLHTADQGFLQTQAQQQVQEQLRIDEQRSLQIQAEQERQAQIRADEQRRAAAEAQREAERREAWLERRTQLEAQAQAAQVATAQARAHEAPQQIPVQSDVSALPLAPVTPPAASGLLPSPAVLRTIGICLMVVPSLILFGWLIWRHYFSSDSAM